MAQMVSAPQVSLENLIEMCWRLQSYPMALRRRPSSAWVHPRSIKMASSRSPICVLGNGFSFTFGPPAISCCSFVSVVRVAAVLFYPTRLGMSTLKYYYVIKLTFQRLGGYLFSVVLLGNVQWKPLMYPIFIEA